MIIAQSNMPRAILNHSAASADMKKLAEEWSIAVTEFGKQRRYLDGTPVPNFRSFNLKETQVAKPKKDKEEVPVGKKKPGKKY